MTRDLRFVVFVSLLLVVPASLPTGVANDFGDGKDWKLSACSPIGGFGVLDVDMLERDQEFETFLDSGGPDLLEECDRDNTGGECGNNCPPPPPPPTPPDPPASQCSDGTDNDHDLKVDHPEDPGCSSRDDNSEAPANFPHPDEFMEVAVAPIDRSGPPPEPPVPQCRDGKDNDLDLRVDYPTDPGCASENDDSEFSLPPPPCVNIQCWVDSVFAPPCTVRPCPPSVKNPLWSGLPMGTDDCVASPLGKVPGVDTDGDLQLDVIDEDDDCDHISDALEDILGAPKGYGSVDGDTDRDGIPDNLDLAPDLNVPVIVVVRALSLTVNGRLADGPSDWWTWDDPYLDGVIEIVPRDDHDEDWQFTIPLLTRDHHVHNLQEINFRDHTPRICAPDCTVEDVRDRQGEARFLPEVNADYYRNMIEEVGSLKIPTLAMLPLPTLRDHDKAPVACNPPPVLGTAALVGVTRRQCVSDPNHNGGELEFDGDERLGDPASLFQDLSWTMFELASGRSAYGTLDEVGMLDPSFDGPEIGLAVSLSLTLLKSAFPDMESDSATIGLEFRAIINLAECSLLIALLAAPLEGTSKFLLAQPSADPRHAGFPNLEEAQATHLPPGTSCLP